MAARVSGRQRTTSGSTGGDQGQRGRQHRVGSNAPTQATTPPRGSAPLAWRWWTAADAALSAPVAVKRHTSRGAGCRRRQRPTRRSASVQAGWTGAHGGGGGGATPRTPVRLVPRRLLRRWWRWWRGSVNGVSSGAGGAAGRGSRHHRPALPVQGALPGPRPPWPAGGPSSPRTCGCSPRPASDRWNRGRTGRTGSASRVRQLAGLRAHWHHHRQGRAGNRGVSTEPPTTTSRRAARRGCPQGALSSTRGGITGASGFHRIFDGNGGRRLCRLGHHRRLVRALGPQNIIGTVTEADFAERCGVSATRSPRLWRQLRNYEFTGSPSLTQVGGFTQGAQRRVRKPLRRLRFRRGVEVHRQRLHHRLKVAGVAKYAIDNTARTTAPMADGGGRSRPTWSPCGECCGRTGVTPYRCTMTPGHSTDSWATVGNQTQRSDDLPRRSEQLDRDGAPIDATSLAPVAVGTSSSVLRMGATGHPCAGYFG